MSDVIVEVFEVKPEARAKVLQRALTTLDGQGRLYLTPDQRRALAARKAREAAAAEAGRCPECGAQKP